MIKPDTGKILSGLKDFQLKTVEYVYERLYGPDPVTRFLIADEVGLGKTMVAKGVVAKAVEHLWTDQSKRIDIIYICANRDIAAQNINRLKVVDRDDIALASRLTLLPLHSHDMNERLNFVSFTPGTSFDLKSRSGIMRERALIYYSLKKGWDIRNASLRNLFQAEAGPDSWQRYIDNFEAEMGGDGDTKLNNELIDRYLNALKKEGMNTRVEKLMERFPRSKKRESVSDADRKDRNTLIGDLRRILARSCLTALEPDLIILDEFQRFKNLLDGEDEVAQLAHDLFNYEGAKIILLSATPYKMYTMTHESETDNHYEDFLATAKFLIGADNNMGDFKAELENYRKALYEVSNKGIDHLLNAKLAVEKRLRNVMVRTERLGVTIDRDGMVADAPLGSQELELSDLKTFKMIDQVARHLEVNDTLEYWKSSPYLLNFMEEAGYVLKKRFVEDGIPQRKIARILEQVPEGLLSREIIQKYKKIDPQNMKMRTLMSNTVEKKAWKLLWVPPSLPYYQPSDVFSDDGLREFTKALVFSSWKMVPKVIATLCSYEAERNVMTTQGKLLSYEEMFRARRPLIVFSASDNELKGMRFFTGLYPCFALAQLIDPLAIAQEISVDGALPSERELLDAIKIKVEGLLSTALEAIKTREPAVAETQRTDQSWYFAALALLDRCHAFEQVKKWRKLQIDLEDDMNWASMIVSRQEDVKGGFETHSQRFWDYYDGKISLGKPPDDLIDVLAKIALASPAVTALRSLMRMNLSQEVRDHGEVLMGSAAKVAMGFRSLFNLPDSIGLIRQIREGEDERYWEEVINYCMIGNLQAVLDEYVHILKESLGLVGQLAKDAAPKMAEEIYTAVSLRTVNLSVDDIKVDGGKIAYNMPKGVAPTVRCRFALRFGDEKNDEDGEETRADQVRKAFNSPFRPFILASTSVGQEGLDFHQYCHSIYHWNLPANPVDLEQREGRIHRYKGHVIRRNIARDQSKSFFSENSEHLCDPWSLLFDKAKARRKKEENDLVPYWIYETDKGLKIMRYVPYLPMSRDESHLYRLKKTLALYRMVFGQPRQEDLLSYLRSRLERDISQEELLMYCIDLQP